MKKFYILHYSKDDGILLKESLVITTEELTPELIEDNRPPEQKFNKAIECFTHSNDIDSLPLDSELEKH